MSLKHEHSNIALHFSTSMEELSMYNPAMGPLPIDIITSILARLPIKCLLRFKLVCKSWLTLITSSYFINFHIRFNSLDNTNQLLIFSSNDDHHSLYTVCLDSLDSFANAMKVSFFKNSLCFSGVASSCNGLLLCVCGTKPPSSDVCLINPCTLQYRRIPKLKVPRNFLYVNYGLGYDCEADDYKVVRIVSFVYCCDNGSVYNVREVMVYSLRTDCWKFIEEKVTNYATLASRNGALVNNHLLHWLFWCTSMNEHRILSFDVCSEQWGEVIMPDYYVGSGLSKDILLDMVDLRVFDGCLCLLTRNFGSNLGGDVDVWVMKTYGVKGSWVKLFNVSDLDITKSLKITPLTYSKNGREILLRKDEESNVFWYDLWKKRGRSVEIYGLPDYCGVYTCIQSLVPLVGYGSRIDTESQQRSRKKEEVFCNPIDGPTL